jgi:hypothetical protein
MSTNDPAQQPPDFPAGVPIYDRNGEKLGIVSTAGVQEQYLVMTEGHLLRRDVNVPISAIDHSDAQGVYLSRTKQEIENLTLGGWSSLGDVDLDSGEPASGATNTPATSAESGADGEKGES